MALDPEELKRRRQEREAQRKARQARKRKLLLRLGIAAVILIACGVLIFLFARQQQGTQKPQTSAASTQQTQPETEGTQSTFPPTTTVRVAFGGDLNVTDRVIESGGESFNYTNTFMDVAHVLADADLSVVNFEGNLCGSPYGTESASAPQQLMDAMDAAGVDLVQLANSYSISNGVSGLQSTINGVYAAGMEPVGAYADQAAYRAGKGYTIRTVDGIDIAFVAFTKGMDGMALPSGSENCVNVLYKDYDSTYQTIDTERINKLLEEVEKADPDITIALLHWGSEYNNTISDSQEKIVSLMKAGGVDVIVGTHSHYVQKVVYDRAAGTFIAYSLGDFCGDGVRAGSEYSIIVELEITKDNTTDTTKVSGWQYTPIFSVNEKNAPHRVLRIREAIASYESGGINKVNAETYGDMVYALERIEARIAGE